MAETTGIDRAYATSYSRSVVTMALSRPFSEILRDNGDKTLFSRTPPLFNAPWGRTPSRFPSHIRHSKPRMVELPDGEIFFTICSTALTHYQDARMDGRTDGRTDTASWQEPLTASRGQ